MEIASVVLNYFKGADHRRGSQQFLGRVRSIFRPAGPAGKVAVSRKGSCQYLGAPASRSSCVHRRNVQCCPFLPTRSVQQSYGHGCLRSSVSFGMDCCLSVLLEHPKLLPQLPKRRSCDQLVEQVGAGGVGAELNQDLMSARARRPRVGRIACILYDLCSLQCFSVADCSGPCWQLARWKF